ncbi:hypothetical protein [Corallococcus exiguus]|nr:hypothetical protein [Corallococcus exiguus]TNV59585.1 hypothetical protein FH620_26630 [Corallococcus exiguus]
MQMLSRTLGALSMFIALFTLTACNQSVEFKGERYNDTIRGNGWSVSATYRINFLTTSAAGSSAGLELSLDGLGEAPPGLKSPQVIIEGLNSSGGSLGKAGFKVTQTNAGTYVLEDPEAVDAWLAGLKDPASLQALLDLSDTGSPFGIALYGDGAHLGSAVFGAK